MLPVFSILEVFLCAVWQSFQLSWFLSCSSQTNCSNFFFHIFNNPFKAWTIFCFQIHAFIDQNLREFLERWLNDFFLTIQHVSWLVFQKRSHKILYSLYVFFQMEITPFCYVFNAFYYAGQFFSSRNKIFH